MGNYIVQPAWGGTLGWAQKGSQTTGPKAEAVGLRGFGVGFRDFGARFRGCGVGLRGLGKRARNQAPPVRDSSI